MTDVNSNIPDAELCAGIRDNDSKSFKIFYFRYAKILFSFVLAKVNHRAEAEDIVQTAFMRIWNERARLDSQKSLKSYLYAIANNLSIDFFRKKRPESYDLTLFNLSIVPKEGVEYNEVANTIRSAIQQLPPGPGKVFCLSRFNDLTYQEIAEILGLSIKTVENHMGKALSLLRSALKHMLPLILLIIYLY